MNVLLIENEEFFVGNLCDYLQRSTNVKVQYATRVKKALDLLADQNFDLVVTELWLPDSTSDDWLLEIGKINPNQKLIIMSSHSMPNTVKPSDKLNIIGYYEKPFDVQIIANLIKQLTN